MPIMAALGRPFGLGMLYDCRQDSLIPGMTLWNPEDLGKDLRERPKPNSEFEIVASESIEDKSSALKVEASLKASFLCGLIEVEGSAKYLNDQRTSKNQVRVTLKYEATTRFQELSMNHLGRGNVKHPYVFDQGLATHVVTGILYGAQAFFVFDREMSEKDDRQDIEGNLKVMIKKIPCLSIEGEGSLKMEDKDKTSVEKFSCKFHGDFSLEKNPVSYPDAVQVYQSLPKLLGSNGEKAVPVKVWLLPLTSLDSSAAQLVRQISVRLIQEAQSVLEDFSELEMRCNDAMRTTTAQQFPQIGKKIKSFKEMCSVFKLEFQRSLSKKLPTIRGGGEEEGALAEILLKRHSSPFNSKNLNEWMDCKEREISILKSFTNLMKNTKIVPSQNGLHEEILSAEHVMCFVFTSLGRAEPYLSALSNYLKGTTKPDDSQDPLIYDVEKEQWYLLNKVPDTMRNKAKLFRDFAELNKEKKNIKFLTVGLTNETHKGSSIYLYKDGCSLSENFEPPSRPETPKTREEFLRYSQEITLDPNTANTHLFLSEGNRKVTVMREEQFYSSHPDRFTGYCQVLSRESLTGRCYWEVERRGDVDVAVAYKNIRRAGRSRECGFGCNEKSCTLQCCENSYNFYYNSIKTPVSGPVSSRVGVYLDHSAGVLSFYSVSDTMTLLHRVQTTFTQPLCRSDYQECVSGQDELFGFHLQLFQTQLKD
uniref:B30.2/SPRY domain-containing protein n=1 Tax=Scophthalmus maximus TaxID=52904 RepID=A0A8D3E008_SCOMX